MGLLSKIFDSRVQSAVRRRNLEKVSELLAKGAPTDEESRRTRPILVAARNVDLPMVKLLLEKGASLEARDALGATPLMLAAGGWNYKGEDKEDRCLELVEALLHKGADPNACGKRGQTPLRHALGAGNKRVMRLLREHGAADYWYDSLCEENGANDEFCEAVRTA